MCSLAIDEVVQRHSSYIDDPLPGADDVATLRRESRRDFRDPLSLTLRQRVAYVCERRHLRELLAKPILRLELAYMLRSGRDDTNGLAAGCRECETAQRDAAALLRQLMAVRRSAREDLRRAHRAVARLARQHGWWRP